MKSPPSQQQHNQKKLLPRKSQQTILLLLPCLPFWTKITNSSSPFTLLPTRDVRDDRHYRRKNKREEHMRSIDRSVFLEKKKIGSRVQSSCYLEPAHPGIPCIPQLYFILLSQNPCTDCFLLCNRESQLHPTIGYHSVSCFSSGF
jgi:hypothetical protein